MASEDVKIEWAQKVMVGEVRIPRALQVELQDSGSD